MLFGLPENVLIQFFVEERLVGAKRASLKMELFGEEFDSPIMTPAFSHLKTFASERENCALRIFQGSCGNEPG